jgi:thiopeptide-type bacteriocin biosynthesis protein
MPLVTNSTHGQWPADVDARWLSARIHTHPERLDEIIAEHLPQLAAALGEQAQYWYIRYRSPHQSDHLRLRVSTPSRGHDGMHVAAIGDWARRLHRAGLASDLAFDTYQPEVGRYGDGPAMHAAEEVFVADSTAVSAQLRHLPPGMIQPTALAAVSMVHIVEGLLGPDPAIQWLNQHRPAASTATDRAVAKEAIRLAQPGALADLPGWPNDLAVAWQARATALASYRRQLPPGTDLDTVVESLLHMHHNRAIGIDPDHEQLCRRLARQAAHTRDARKVEAAP